MRNLLEHWFFWLIAFYTSLAMLAFAYLAFDFVTHPLAPEYSYGSTVLRLFLGLVLTPIGITISILVLRRSRYNVTGLFLLMWTANVMTSTLRMDSPLSADTFNFTYLGIWLLPLYFPDGQPAPRRFQGLIRGFTVLMTILWHSYTFLAPTQTFVRLHQTLSVIPNPLFITALQSFAEPALTLQGLFWICTVLFIAPSLILRYRESNSAVRQQIKWFVWIFSLFAIAYVLSFIMTGGAVEQPQIPAVKLLVFILEIFFPIGPFLAVGLAILRHKLYDIDIIIRRTLVYAILTGILAVIYFGGIVLAQQVFRIVTGESSDLAIVISTLLIAALFTPIRRRVQGVIDRRLYRRKYDSERMLQRFNTTLRDEVNLDELIHALTGVVDDTMQPAKLALWVRETSHKEAK